MGNPHIAILSQIPDPKALNREKSFIDKMIRLLLLFIRLCTNKNALMYDILVFRLPEDIW